MTRSAESNAIFGSSVLLYIVYVMNTTTVFLTESACVIVAFSNCIFKFFSPLFRVILSPSLSASPLMRFFSYRESYVTRPRTKNTVYFRWSLSKFFSTCLTDKSDSFGSINIMAFSGAKFVSRTCTYLSSAFFSANNTFVFWLSAIPKSGTFSNSHKFFTSARVGAKTRLVFSRVDNLKRFSAILTRFIYHVFTLKGASRSTSQYCYLGNTG